MLRNQTTVVASPAAMKLLGKTVGQGMKTGGVIALYGTLGSGKTTFVQGLARGLGIRQKITSPTFVVMSSYPIPNGRRHLYHFDLYRLRRGSELLDLGFQDIVKNPHNLVAIEWPEIAASFLPAHTKKIYFSHAERNPKTRRITQA